MVGKIDAKMVALAALQAILWQMRLSGFQLNILARHCQLLIDILNPECIVIGSIYARNEMLFKPLIEKVIRQEAIPASLEVCRIMPAGLGDSIGDYAALCVALYEDKF